MLLKSIGVSGFRCFNTRQIVKIKPINILVGKNGSGKSSFARLFPLLRQSIEKKTKGPLLWYGQYVDFGSYEISKSKQEASETIDLSFDICLSKEKLSWRLFRRMLTRPQPFIVSDVTVNVVSSLAYNQRDNSTYTSKLEILIFDSLISFGFDGNRWLSSVTINGSEYKLPKKLSGYVFSNELIPTFKLFERMSTSDGDIEWRDADQDLFRNFVKYIKHRTHSNLGDEKISSFIKSVKLDNRRKMVQNLSQIYTSSSSIQSYIERLQNDSQAFESFLHHYLMINLSVITTAINEALFETFSKVKYIKPLRATAQRYYRHQELSVDEIDSEGANIAMYLESLQFLDRQSLNEWLLNRVGFTIDPKREGGHIGLQILDNKSQIKANLADMGFGYSQVIPILIHLWAVTNQQKVPGLLGYEAEVGAIVVEQPELHLHPEMQANLANLFVEVSRVGKEQNIAFPFIIETHSAHIINRLGKLVAKQELDHDDVNICLFEQLDNGSTNIRSVKFDSEGYLVDWPYGFFEPV